MDPLAHEIARRGQPRRHRHLGQAGDLPAAPDRAELPRGALERGLDVVLVVLAIGAGRQLDAQVLAAAERERARGHAGAQVIALDDARGDRADLLHELAQRVADLVVDHPSTVVAIIVVGCG